MNKQVFLIWTVIVFIALLVSFICLLPSIIFGWHWSDLIFGAIALTITVWVETTSLIPAMAKHNILFYEIQGDIKTGFLSVGVGDHFSKFYKINVKNAVRGAEDAVMFLGFVFHPIPFQRPVRSTYKRCRIEDGSNKTELITVSPNMLLPYTYSFEFISNNVEFGNGKTTISGYSAQAKVAGTIQITDLQDFPNFSMTDFLANLDAAILSCLGGKSLLTVFEDPNSMKNNRDLSLYEYIMGGEAKNENGDKYTHTGVDTQRQGYHFTTLHITDMIPGDEATRDALKAQAQADDAIRKSVNQQNLLDETTKIATKEEALRIIQRATEELDADLKAKIAAQLAIAQKRGDIAYIESIAAVSTEAFNLYIKNSSLPKELKMYFESGSGSANPNTPPIILQP